MELITIKGVPVIDIYESWDGSYWFVTEKAWRQDSIICGKVYQNDQILFGFVRLSSCPDCAEWGYFSEGELTRLAPRVWKVRQRDWAVCPDVEVEQVPETRASVEVEDGGTSVPAPASSQTLPPEDGK